MTSPYEDGSEVYVVPPLKPTSRSCTRSADRDGNAQIWGLLGCQKEAAFAADRVIVVVEELVDGDVIRRDPNRTVIPGIVVDAVVEEPFARHPSFTQGYYDRDNAFYLAWDAIARDPATLDPGSGVGLRAGLATDYVEKWGAEHWASLKPGPALSGEVDYVKSTRERLLQERADDRGERAAARRCRELLRRRAADRLQPRAAHGRPEPSSSTNPACSALAPVDCRCRSATRRSRPDPRR